MCAYLSWWETQLRREEKNTHTKQMWLCKHSSIGPHGIRTVWMCIVCTDIICIYYITCSRQVSSPSVDALDCALQALFQRVSLYCQGFHVFHMQHKLTVKPREVVLHGQSSNPKAWARGYCHTYFDTHGIDLMTLASSLPMKRFSQGVLKKRI